MVELRQLRYFVAVAEEGSVSRAAQRLHLSQPPLSTQLRQLEDELGVRLFERSNRGIVLTAAGTVFQAEARAVLARLEQGKRQAREAGREDVGTLTVGFVSIAALGVLPPALKAFRARYPAVEVELHELTTDAQVRELRAGRLDLGVGLAPVEEADLQFEGVLREPLLLAAPASHALARGEGAVDLRAFAAEAFIIPPRPLAPGLYDVVMEQCRAAGFAPRVTQQARQMQTVIGLVAAGMGFALVPASVGSLRRVGVRFRRLRGRGPRVELGLLQPRRTVHPLREKFADRLRAAAREIGSG